MEMTMTVSDEELERLYALEDKVREVLDASQAFCSCWEFDTYEQDVDGIELRKELEALLDQGDGYAVSGLGGCNTPGRGAGTTATEE
jgi:hypothetical protein